MKTATKKQKKLNSTTTSKTFSRIGIIFSFLALITIPSAPLWGILLCKNNECDLNNFYLLGYAIVACVIFGVIGGLSLICSLLTRSTGKIKTK